MTLDSIATAITNLNPDEIKPVVEQICGTGFAAVGSPMVRAIGKKSVGAGTQGIFHVAGTAQNGDRQTPWSAVVKALGGSEGFSQDPSIDLDREIEVYRSGAFFENHGNFRAARCYSVHEFSEDSTWLWLEDLTEALNAPWPLEQYPVSAQHLGEFNAAWNGRSLPDWDWLNPAGIQGKWRGSAIQSVFEDLPGLRDHPFIQAITPTAGFDRLLRHWDDGQLLLSAVEAFENGVSHHDVHPKNLFVLNHQTNSAITVAADWSSVGKGPLGSDLGNLIVSPLKWLEISVDDAKSLIEPTLDGYLRGIRNAGWDNDDSAIRLAYLASVGVFGANNIISITQKVATGEAASELIVETVGFPIEEILAGYREALELLLRVSDDALQLV